MPQKSDKSAKVVVYTTPNCQHCRQVKQWLLKHEIPFLDFNVSKPGKIQKQFFRLGGRSVPMLVIGDKLLNGFDPQELKKTLITQGLMPGS